MENTSPELVEQAGSIFANAPLLIQTIGVGKSAAFLTIIFAVGLFLLARYLYCVFGKSSQVEQHRSIERGKNLALAIDRGCFSIAVALIIFAALNG